MAKRCADGVPFQPQSTQSFTEKHREFSTRVNRTRAGEMGVNARGFRCFRHSSFALPAMLRARKPRPLGGSLRVKAPPTRRSRHRQGCAPRCESQPGASARPLMISANTMPNAHEPPGGSLRVKSPGNVLLTPRAGVRTKVRNRNRGLPPVRSSFRQTRCQTRMSRLAAACG
jgi:hypothetical protein